MCIRDRGVFGFVRTDLERKNHAGLPSLLNETFLAIDVGWAHSCGIQTDKTLACWGWNGDNPSHNLVTGALPGTFLAIAAGSRNTCALKTDNTLECWGSNDSNRNIAPGGNFLALGTGGAHSCAIKDDANKTVECWGYGGNGRTTAPDGLTARTDLDVVWLSERTQIIKTTLRIKTKVYLEGALP